MDQVRGHAISLILAEWRLVSFDRVPEMDSKCTDKRFLYRTHCPLFPWAACITVWRDVSHWSQREWEGE